MDKTILYHGSNVEVPFPRILQNGFYKDFGYGFYCTLFEKQAKRWAMTRKGESVVNLYEYVPNDNLNILKFEEMCEEWLNFIVNCRNGIEHNYDIVEGLWQMIRFGITLKDSLKATFQEKHSGNW